MEIFTDTHTIVLHSNDEQYTVPLTQLETIDGLPLPPKDAVSGTEVMWMYKGKTPYKATIVKGDECSTAMDEDVKGSPVLID